MVARVWSYKRKRSVERIEVSRTREDWKTKKKLIQCDIESVSTKKSDHSYVMNSL